MSLFEFLGNLFSLNNEPTTTGTDINPANGLPMMGFREQWNQKPT